jgi:uridine kinase
MECGSRSCRLRMPQRAARTYKGGGCGSKLAVIEQYMTTVRPMHEEFVEPSKRYADLILPEGGENLVAIDAIIARVERLLA